MPNKRKSGSYDNSEPDVAPMHTVNQVQLLNQAKNDPERTKFATK
jgi:hypothetical protein